MNNANWSVIAQVLKTYFPWPQTQSSPKPLSRFTQFRNPASTGEHQYNEPLYNENLGITNDFLYPSNGKIYEKEPRYSEQILPVPWAFVISRFNVPRKIITHFRLASLPRLHFTISDHVRNIYAELPYQLVNEEGKGVLEGRKNLPLPWSETVAPKSNQIVRRRGIDW